MFGGVTVVLEGRRVSPKEAFVASPKFTFKEAFLKLSFRHFLFSSFRGGYRTLNAKKVKYTMMHRFEIEIKWQKCFFLVKTFHLACKSSF